MTAVGCLQAAFLITCAVCLSGQVQAQIFQDEHVCWSCRAEAAVETQPASPRAQANRPKRTANKTKASASSDRVDTSSPVARQKVALHVDENDRAIMDLALNNARNIVDYYKAQGETVAIEIVTYGPGLHMLRADTSPVKDRIATMSLGNPNLAFIACGNTQANQSKAEGKSVTLISEATVTPSGVVRLMELQKKGYAYIRP